MIAYLSLPNSLLESVYIWNEDHKDAYDQERYVCYKVIDLDVDLIVIESEDCVLELNVELLHGWEYELHHLLYVDIIVTLENLLDCDIVWRVNQLLAVKGNQEYLFPKSLAKKRYGTTLI